MRSMIVLILVLAVVLVVMLTTSRRRTNTPPRAEASQDSDDGGRLPTDQMASDRVPLKLPLVEPKIVVTKSQRQLALYSAGKVARIYRIGLGFNPVDDKTREGDGCTPEGKFYIFTRNGRSAYYLSLGISYPNIENAARGLRDGLITPAQYDRIVSANRRRIMPPQDTTLGGQIYIHGRGAQSDWTWGCIALEDRDMRELFDAVPVGTEVIIEH